MFTFQITINGENVTEYACYPLSGQLALDRGLDQGYIELRNSPRSEPYQPFSRVEITATNSTPTIFYVASDEVETIVKTGRSMHRILLSEETKILERVICPGKTFVQPLVKNYAKINGEASPEPSYYGKSISWEYAWGETGGSYGEIEIVYNNAFPDRMYKGNGGFVSLPALSNLPMINGQPQGNSV